VDPLAQRSATGHHNEVFRWLHGRATGKVGTEAMLLVFGDEDQEKRCGDW